MARAQKYVPKKIVFSGTTASQAELLAVSGLKPGDTLGQAEIQAAAQKLIDTGLFTDVRFAFDGVELDSFAQARHEYGAGVVCQISMVG